MKTLLIFFLTTLGVFAQGGPPAPPTIIFGNVRDSGGSVINDPDFTEIVLFADGSEIDRVGLEPHPTRDENYRFEITNTSGSVDNRVFSVKLERDGQFLTIFEASTTVFILNPVPASLNRFDFIQSDDTDSDGLPDNWEMVQLAEIGLTDLSLLTPDDDFDFDGLSNRDEFVTGTFATVFTSQVNFKVNGTVTGDWLSVSFDTVADRSYQLLASTDGSNFSPVDIAVNDVRTNLISSYEETSDQRITVTTAPVVGEGVFYRVAVR